jgi:hypothetical protein
MCPNDALATPGSESTPGPLLTDLQSINETACNHEPVALS